MAPAESTRTIVRNAHGGDKTRPQSPMTTKAQEVTALIERAVKMVVKNDPPHEVCIALTDAIEAMSLLLLNPWPLDWQPMDTLPEGDYVLLRFAELPYPVVGNSEFWSYKSGGWRATGWMRVPPL